MEFVDLMALLQDQTNVAKDLAQSLDMPIGQLYYKWSMGEIEQTGMIDNERSYFFHGLDCTKKNR